MGDLIDRPFFLPQKLKGELRFNVRIWKLFVVILIAIAFVAVAIYFRKPSSPQTGTKVERYNFVLISIDTARADAFGIYGNQTAQTPMIDSFAREGTLYQNAIAHVPLTLPSHASMLTGLLPARHGIRDNHGYRLEQNTSTLPLLFQQNGYKTAAFVSSIVLDHRFGLARGFDVYNDFIQYGSQDSNQPQNERLAGETAAEAVKWITSNLQNPFFVFVHFYDPHARYNPPEPYRSRFSNPYFGEIAYVDAQIGLVLQSVKNVQQKTVVLVTADHGEGLGEHNELGHGLFIYDSTIRIPFLIKGPKIPTGKIIQQQIQLVDVTPTFLELAGIQKPSGLDGRSLVPLLGGNSWNESPAIIESQYALGIGWSPLYGIRSSEWKIIDAPERELYDLQNDASEIKNQQFRNDSSTRTLSERLQKYKQIPPMSDKKQESDPELEEQLRSLGYLSGTSKPKNLENLPDPKSKIEVWKLYEQSTFLSMEGKKTEAVELLERAVKLDSTNPVLLDTLAQFIVDSDPKKAVELWQKALRLSPEDHKMHHRLALGFKRLGEIEKSIIEEKIALKIDPEMQEALVNLAETLIGIGKPQEALPYLQKSLQLDPNNAAASYQAGNAYRNLGDIGRGIEHFENAIRFNPSLPQPYYSLAILKGQTGDLSSAEQLLRKALQLNPSFAEAYYNLGIVLERSGRQAEAVEAYKQFITYADPNIHASRIEAARQKLR